MATKLNSAAIAVKSAFDYSNSVDVGSVSHVATFNPSHVFTDGTGAKQAKAVFADDRTLLASGTENLDLAGGLTDAFGNAITFTKIKAIVIHTSKDNTNDLLVGGTVTNALASLFGDTSDSIRLKPGTTFVVATDDATAYVVTAGTADLLKMTNSAAGSSVAYRIQIIGTA